MDILEELFGSQARVRMMKLFFKNEVEQFSKRQIVDRTEQPEPKVRKELATLTAIGLLMERKKNNEKWYELNPGFLLLHELKEVLNKAEYVPNKKMIAELEKLGDIKLAIIAGELIQEAGAEADLFIVAANLNEKKFAEFVKSLEADVGTELRYATMTEKEFIYRCDMFDRFTIELLRNPHRELINRIPRLPKQLMKASRSRR